ncbi:TATA box-binding protein [Faustovirus]|nr:hypothetical protein F-M6_0316 [Faustovirus]QJX72573.1 TATA box-binding protein [Faustovirus]QJX73070.1 hypothetical protein F-VV57_0309 [Faustovirus]QJX73577.1 hypothetical protein F-VV63_0311 [Faustovirus]QJX74084.1 hypothetical protein F-E9_330 [Faustovirus]
MYKYSIHHVILKQKINKLSTLFTYIQQLKLT